MSKFTSPLCHHDLNLVESQVLEMRYLGNTICELIFFLLTPLLPFEIVAKLHSKGKGN